VIDEMLQIHGGNGFVTDYPIERAYRDNRVNRIFEGTNEINRLLIPGMIFKRAMKGEIPLMEAVLRLDEELSDPRHFSSNASAFDQGPGAGKAVTLLPVGRLAAERRGAEMAKRQFLFAAKWAATLGPSLEERQEVLAALADCAIEVYAMDSILGRTLESADHAEFRDGLCRFFCMESRERAFDRARTAICAVAAAEEVEARLEQLSRLHKYTPVNSAEAREQIVPALLDFPGYPLVY
jgi:alkylation response protein AidB-like acyl-CoA dehydrogenase